MLEELKTFISVVELKNFTKAGEYLNLSQPSVSTHIKNLESYFGVVLINRSIKQKHIFITESGYILYKRAKEILNLVDLTYMDVRDTSNSFKGHIKIGASLTIGEYLLPQFLASFSKKYPDVIVEVFIENTTVICNHLKDLNFDIGLIEGTSIYPDFNQDYFLKDKMVLATPLEYELNSSNFSFDKLKDQNWIAREEGSGTREFMDMFLNNNKIIPKNIITFGSNYAVKEAVRNSIGITIISDLVTRPAVKNNEISVIDIGESYYRCFSLILPRNITTSNVTQVFIDELKGYVSNINK